MTRLHFLERLGDWSQGEGPLYARLADATRAAIERGELPVGSRLPAQRVLARWLDVSRTTVVMAYDALSTGGWLESRHGSGTSVRRAPTPLTATRGGAAAVLAARNVVFRGLVERTGAEFEFLGAHLEGVPRMFDAVWSAARRDLSRLVAGHGYLPLGLPELRRAIADHLGRAGLPTRPEQVLVTSGAQQALTLVANLHVEAGDPVLLEDPTYPGALDAFTSFGAQLVGLPLGPAGLDPESVRAAVTRTPPRLVYLVPTCHNPTGDIVSEAVRRDVMRTLEPTGALIVEDMTLADLALSPPPRPLATFAREATVLTVGSLSKLFWGGLRVGWIRGPEPEIARLSRLKVVSDLSGSIVSQAVATHVLARAKELTTLRRRQVRTRLALAERLLSRHLPTWRWRRPRGGLSLWVRLPAGDATAFAAVALQQGVAIVPGSVHSASERWPDYVRLPFASEPRAMDEGMRRLGEAWAEYAPASEARRKAVGVLV